MVLLCEKILKKILQKKQLLRLKGLILVVRVQTLESVVMMQLQEKSEDKLVHLNDTIRKITLAMENWKGHWRQQLDAWDEQKPLCPKQFCERFLLTFVGSPHENPDFDAAFDHFKTKHFPFDDGYFKAQKMIGYEAANEVITNHESFDDDLYGAVKRKRQELEEEIRLDYDEFCGLIKEELREAVQEVSNHLKRIVVPQEALKLMDSYIEQLEVSRKRRRSQSYNNRLEYLKLSKVCKDFYASIII